MILSKFWIPLIALAFIVPPLNRDPAPCKIPVFRYALENWIPAPYEAVIVHRGTLSEDAKAWVTKLQESASNPKRPVNLKVKTINVAEDPESELLSQVLGTGYQDSIASPELVLLYPAESQSGPLAWRGPLTAEHVEALLDSPARAQMTKWILDGESVVWVLIGGGDPEKDDAAEQLVRAEIAKLETELVMRDLEVIQSEKQFGSDTKVELRLGIKLLVLDRNEPQEKIFAATILNSEADLSELSEPIVMPVFGRGRAYLSLAGKGINPKMLETTCRFLIADCSCEVKRLNPGVDLLFSVDWDGSITGTVAEDPPSPSPTGSSVYVDIPPGNATPDRPTDGASVETPEPKVIPIFGSRLMIWITGLTLLGIALVSILTRFPSRT